MLLFSIRVRYSLDFFRVQEAKCTAEFSFKENLLSMLVHLALVSTPEKPLEYHEMTKKSYLNVAAGFSGMVSEPRV
jgi:hypothetical protein